MNEYEERKRVRDDRLQTVSAWLLPKLAGGPILLSEVFHEGTDHGFTVSELCAALERVGGHRVGKSWTLKCDAAAPTLPASVAAAPKTRIDVAKRPSYANLDSRLIYSRRRAEAGHGAGSGPEVQRGAATAAPAAAQLPNADDLYARRRKEVAAVGGIAQTDVDEQRALLPGRRVTLRPWG